jgi:asparagine synthetase B (glutamine-hydrolysing)
LAILDLSPAGHQPMVSASAWFVPCRNGCVLYAVAHGGFPQ